MYGLVEVSDPNNLYFFEFVFSSLEEAKEYAESFKNIGKDFLDLFQFGYPNLPKVNTDLQIKVFKFEVLE